MSAIKGRKNLPPPPWTQPKTVCIFFTLKIFAVRGTSSKCTSHRCKWEEHSSLASRPYSTEAISSILSKVEMTRYPIENVKCESPMAKPISNWPCYPEVSGPIPVTVNLNDSLSRGKLMDSHKPPLLSLAYSWFPVQSVAFTGQLSEIKSTCYAS